MPDINEKRLQNEKKYLNWIDLPESGRKYWFEIKGKFGWKARYLKEVNFDEETIRFCQEIYDSDGKLVEIHEKYPIDKGHSKARE